MKLKSLKQTQKLSILNELHEQTKSYLKELYSTNIRKIDIMEYGNDNKYSSRLLSNLIKTQKKANLDKVIGKYGSTTKSDIQKKFGFLMKETAKASRPNSVTQKVA